MYPTFGADRDGESTWHGVFVAGPRTLCHLRDLRRPFVDPDGGGSERTTGVRRVEHGMTYRCTAARQRRAALAVIAHPDLELVGCSYSPDKSARRGTIGGDPVGIIATDDVDAVLALRRRLPLLHGRRAQVPGGVGRGDVPLPRPRGPNVVTTSVLALVNPATAPPGAAGADRGRVPRAGSTTFFCNGADPGFASDLVPITLLALMDDVEAVRIQEIINYGFYDQVETMRVLFGFGAAARLRSAALHERRA